MSDIFKHTSISKFEGSDPSYLRVNESSISRSLDKERNVLLKYKYNSINSKKLLFAAVMGVLEERSLDGDPQNLSHISAGEREFYYLLSSLSGSFLTLSSIDKSTDITFINTLSDTWNFLNLSIKRRQAQKHALPYITLLTETFQEIESFREGEGETFGYYLEAHKKSDWFPVPYLQMLQQLHQESIDQGADSHLRIWQENISQLLISIISTA